MARGAGARAARAMLTGVCRGRGVQIGVQGRGARWAARRGPLVGEDEGEDVAGVVAEGRGGAF